MPKLVYLAAPYSHPDYDVRMHRFRSVTWIASKLMQQGELIYSPITHGHALTMVNRRIPTDWKHWESHCKAVLQACEIVLVATLPGWEESVGVQAELKIASELGIGFKLISPWDYINRTEYIKGQLIPQ